MPRSLRLPYRLLLALCLGVTTVTGSAQVSPADTMAALKGHPACDTARYWRAPAFLFPGVCFLYGGLKPLSTGIRQLDDSLYTRMLTREAGFHVNAEDYLMWTPSAAIYALDALHVKTRHTFAQHLLLDAGSILVTGGAGLVMRRISRQIPAYSAYPTKFPSGHTANAFRSAELFHQELRFTHPVLSYGGYVVAGTVGVLRLYNKDHLLSEVLTGAGLGILSTKFTYWLFGKITCRKGRARVP